MPTVVSQSQRISTPSPAFQALSKVLDFLKAMRTATAIPAREAMEYAKLEEEFTTRLDKAKNER